MANETGIFSVRRPRETLGGLSHNASALPLPSSALKRSSSIGNNHGRSVSGSRMSLAPGRPSQPVFTRTSSGSNLADMATSTANRTSSINMYGSGSQGARKSIVPQTPAAQSTIMNLGQSTQRRSSIYSGRQSMGPMAHQSFFTQAPAPAGVPKDPRPLKDRSYQAQIGQELLNYLTHNNFEMDMKHSLTQNTLRSPTQKDFNFMFQWLYNRIDPSYRFHGKIDQEVPAILKQLRYPFEKSITKSQIAAVGGNNWGTFLGMLHWMMQLARMGEQFNSGAYDDVCMDAGHDVSADRVIFDFLKDAYHAWLHMEDDADDDKADEVLKPYVDRMASQFEQSNSKYNDQVKMLEAEHESLQNQIDELGKAGPRIAKLDEQIKILEEDRGKFESWNSNMEAKIKKYETREKLLEDEIAKVEAELQEAENDKADLQADLDSKGMNVTDIDRLITQRERLQKDMELHAERLEDMKRRVTEKEEAANELVLSLENKVHEYNTLGFNVGVIPKSAANAKGQDFELSLRLNPAPDFKSSARAPQGPQPDRLLADSTSGYLPQHLLSLDMKGAIKSAIMALRKEISARRNQIAEADMKNKELLDNIREAIEDKQQEVEKLQYQLKTAETDYNNFREATNAQKMASDAQIEKLEKELARMRSTLTESVELMEQREMNTSLEYEQLQENANTLREELHTEVERTIEDVVHFKLHIQRSLEAYEDFVVQECEQEIVEGEAEEARE